ITNLTRQQVIDGGLIENDVVVLRDPDDWPMVVNGYMIGTVTRIEEQAKAPLFAEITLTPRLNLRQLREVMVVTGKYTPDPKHPAAPEITVKSTGAQTPAAQQRHVST